jgi:aminomethyltransferase
VVWAKIAGVETQAARSGYTGEDGYELICDAADAVRLWEALLDSGVTPCGLGARDTLRVEAGLPLYGHELSDDMSPISAGLGWVISKTKTFIGSEPMNLARTSGTPTKLVGIILDSKRLATPGMNILLGGQPVGKVSSGVISPTLDTGIALAFVSRDIPLDTACFVDTRGKRESGRIVSKRMFKRS